MAKDLISKILAVDTNERLDVEGIMNHPWIVGEDTPRKELQDVQEQIKKYNALRKMKKATYSIMAANRFKNILTEKSTS